MGLTPILAMAGLLAVGWHAPFATPYTEATWSKGVDCSTPPNQDLGTSRLLSTDVAPWEQSPDWAGFFLQNGPGYPVHLTLCVFDRALNRLLFHTLTLQPDPQTYHRLNVDLAHLDFSLPADHVVVIAEARGPGQSLAMVSVTTFMPTCGTHRVIISMEVFLRPTQSDADLGGSICTMPFPLEGWSGEYERVDYTLVDGDGTVLRKPDSTLDWRPGAAFAGLAGGGAAVALLPRFRWAALGLFSRLRPHRLLDQKVRAQIHELVSNDPGIHLGEMARRLEIGGTTAVHHLRILVREKVLQRVRQGNRTHFFVAGRFGPLEAAVLCEIREPTSRRLLRAADSGRWTSLAELAEACDLRRPAASKILRRLRRTSIMSAQRSARGLDIRVAPAAAVIVRRATMYDP